MVRAIVIWLALIVIAQCASVRAVERPIVLSAPLTHSGWMVHANQPAWGTAGVQHMRISIPRE